MEKGGRKALPSRESRGTRIHKLIGEEAEADEAFWNQDAWNEDAEDSDYSSEEEEEDVVDSDFDEEEAPDEDVHGDEDEDGGRRKRGRPTKEETAKRRAYQEPQRGVKRSRRTDSTTELSNAGASADGASATEPRSVVTAGAPVAYEVPTLRHSTAQKSSESSDLRRKIFEEAARLAAKVKKPPIVKMRLTQEQLLVEAVRTELENTQSLNRLERLEEEKKAENVITPKAPYTGLIVRYHSRIGAPKTITFLNTDRFPKIFDQQQPRKRERLAPREERVEDDDDGDEDDDEDADEDDGQDENENNEDEEDEANSTDDADTAEEDDQRRTSG